MLTYSVHQTIVSLCASMKRMFVGGECRGGPTQSHDYREYCYEAMNLIDTYLGDVLAQDRNTDVFSSQF